MPCPPCGPRWNTVPKSAPRGSCCPAGQLRMRPDRAVEKYQFISNNDESLKRIAFDLVGMRDFEIDGNGTELLFTASSRRSASKTVRTLRCVT